MESIIYVIAFVVVCIYLYNFLVARFVAKCPQCKGQMVTGRKDMIVCSNCKYVTTLKR